MKKNKNIEMKIYELLGVKIFKKFIFRLFNTLEFFLTTKNSKEASKKALYNPTSNYNLGKTKSLEDIKKFKKQLFINASIHTWALIWTLSMCILNSLKITGETVLLPITITNLSAIIINLYCIMLQRYNYIRINQVIKKMRPQYEKQKEKIKEELSKNDAMLKNHTYKIINKKGKENNIYLENLIESANIEQLKQYREWLSYFQIPNQKIYGNSDPSKDKFINDSIPIENHKTLKLELKNKLNNL